MSPFWEGFYRVWGSRTAIDTWLTATGFAIGAHAVRGQWGWVLVYLILSVFWFRLSRLKQRQGSTP